MYRRILPICLCLTVGIMTASAKLHLPEMFQDGMVMQRARQAALWGYANPGETVTATWKKKKYCATADGNGQWTIMLPANKAGGPYVLEVADASGDRTIISDILVGDVWMVSGQSNVDVTVERVYPQYASDIDKYTNDNIRLFRVQKNPQTERQTDMPKDHWRHASRKEAWDYSALGYFLARQMYLKTGIPQGIICNSVGGSPIQAWIDLDSISQLRNAEAPVLSNAGTEYYQKYLLYTDKEYVREQDAANKRAGELWTRLVNDNDPGISGQWTSDTYDDSSWTTVSQYHLTSIKQQPSINNPFHGTLWLRQHITIDKEHAGKPARLLLGRIYDQDFAFVNGRQVGVTWYQYPPRRYTIPEGLLHEGDNVITVRIVNKNGMPEFFPEKPYKVVFDDKEIALSENWKAHTGAIVTECLGGRSDLANQASVLYNGMLCPVAPYTINGVVWYQGESNTSRPMEYGPLLSILMANWRKRFSDDRLPFVITQIANYQLPSDKPQNSGMAALREQQRLVANADPYARVVTAIDLGETYDIHPLRKQEVAQRCTDALANMVWKERNPLSPQPVKAEATNPQPSTITSQPSTIKITMDQPVLPGVINEFEVAGTDGKYHNAKAVANGNTITVTCSEVSTPVSVRYAWKDNPANANCKGTTGLPATPFQIRVITNY